MTASQHMVHANGLRFRTMVDGPAGGELFILLHGFPEGAESWSKQVEALSRAGCLTVAPDLRGYGLSDAPDGVEHYAITHLVEDVAGIIKAFGRAAAHVAGHDWGAVVAWFFAGRHPEMTKTLTALSVAHPAALAASSREDEDQQTRSRYVALFLMEGKAERVLADEDHRRLRAMFASGPKPDAVPRGVIDHFTRSLGRPGRLTAALNYYRANLRTEGGAWEALAGLGAIQAPTQLLWGDQDPALGRRAIEATAARVQGEFRLEILAGAGHWLQFERPDEVNRALTRAASKLSGMLHRDEQERRQGLRRLDDILDTLEQLNLHDRTELPDHVAEALVLLGITAPHSIPVPQLIERVWAMQQPYLITIVVERRRRRRRKVSSESALV